MKLCPHCLKEGFKSLLKPLNPVGAIIQTYACVYCSYRERVQRQLKEGQYAKS